jgi:serine/threonine protein kinase
MIEKAGDRIGRYKLLEQVGEGGCGVVYVAEQDQPVRRRVALKVIKLGMDTRQVIARFEAERQALALMDHPNIAKVLDAGATEAGRPFFVMELVRGVKITDYCDRNNLPTIERLNLFIQVCNAIQHAHQKGIIHRDIKPSNILVTLHDGVPVPKVIDFGIAKATTDQRLTDKTLYTAIEQFIGTPAYMSPEQAELSGLDIDTRSDIYALGVLLYELLTGKTPFDSKRLVSAGLDEIRRIIREEDPPRPSTCISTLDAAEQTALAKRRHCDPPRLIGSIRGDLDWIVMKTLEKDRTRRYETANGLAMDLKRFLDSEPVLARPAGTLYRWRKTVRRHKLAFAAAGSVGLTLLAGAGVSTWLLFKEREAHRQALAAQQAQLVFQRKAQAVEETQRQLHEQIERADAATRKESLAHQLVSRNELAEAEALYREAAAAYSELFGSESLAALRPLHSLAMTLKKDGKLEEAESVLREAVARGRKLGGADSPNSLSFLGLVLHHLAEVLLEREAVPEARTLASEAVTIYEHHPDWPGDERGHALHILSDVADALARQNQPQQAEESHRQVLDSVRKSCAATGKHEARLGLFMHHFAEFLEKQNKFEEALSLAEEAVALYHTHSEWPGNERNHAERVLASIQADMSGAVSLPDGTVVTEPAAPAKHVRAERTQP